MKRIISILISAALLTCLAATDIQAKTPIRVKSYMKKSGTYVNSYQRTKPDKSKINNYSTKWNVNPYTGKNGNKNP